MCASYEPTALIECVFSYDYYNASSVNTEKAQREKIDKASDL